ncbi:hypothetical protein Tco_1107963 [Tanacetum coccineum]
MAKPNNYITATRKNFVSNDNEGRMVEKCIKNNDKAKDTEKPWSENGVPYQLCDHICELYRFKNGRTKWPTCTSDIDGFYNGGELPRMVRVGSMTYFQDHRWYDKVADGKLKDEILALKSKMEGSWGDATLGVLKFCK